jgi:hypothetical protein
MPLGKLSPIADHRVWTARWVQDPLRPRLRILSQLEKGHLDEALSRWASQGFIEASSALVACNPVFVEKRNGKIRTCINYIPINKAIEDFDWPLPRIQDFRHHLAGAKWFTRLDLTDAFHHIRVPREYRPATAFATHRGTMQFTRMPFGLKTAPSVFQRFMDITFHDHRDESIWYIDDILVYAKTKAELLTRVHKVLCTIRREGLEVNQDKSEYSKQEIDYVGLHISAEGIRATSRVSEIGSHRVPYTLKDRQSFLGFANYFRDFIPEFSRFAEPLYPDRRNIPRSDDYEADFNTFVRHCMSHVSLSHYHDEWEADLYTDASGYATGAVLVQRGKVCAVFSKKLTLAQSRYSATDREHLGLLLAVEHFRAFTQSNKCLRVSTDHKALLDRHDDLLTPRQARWKHRIMTWAGRVAYVKGDNNPADYWSRFGAKAGDGGANFL